jgi:hypothetical protein
MPGRKLIDDPEFWHSRAEVVRTIAKEMEDRHGKAIMDRIAEDYERLAQHAEQRRRLHKRLAEQELGKSPAHLYQNIRTYKCRSAGARYRIDMPKKVRAATLGTAAAAVWFAVVTLGFGAQLWPLFEGAR